MANIEYRLANIQHRSSETGEFEVGRGKEGISDEVDEGAEDFQPQPRFTSHQSPVTSHQSPITNHESQVTIPMTTHTADETRLVGARIAGTAKPGDVFALVGDLGAGKTEFVRGFVAALNATALVTSPSFSILNTYPTPAFPIHHFDFYRLTDVAELREIGYEEYVGPDAVCLIEWADLFPQVLPVNVRRITFADLGEGKREIVGGEYSDSGARDQHPPDGEGHLST